MTVDVFRGQRISSSVASHRTAGTPATAVTPASVTAHLVTTAMSRLTDQCVHTWSVRHVQTWGEVFFIVFLNVFEIKDKCVTCR